MLHKGCKALVRNERFISCLLAWLLMLGMANLIKALDAVPVNEVLPQQGGIKGFDLFKNIAVW